MPSHSQHIDKFKHNIKFIDSGEISSKHNDWKVTIIFYAAVHLIEAYLSQNGYHTESHKSRFNWINKIPSLKAIAIDYQTLYNYSIKSRYMCYHYKDDEVEVIRGLLDNIKSKIS